MLAPHHTLIIHSILGNKIFYTPLHTSQLSIKQRATSLSKAVFINKISQQADADMFYDLWKRQLLKNFDLDAQWTSVDSTDNSQNNVFFCLIKNIRFLTALLQEEHLFITVTIILIILFLIGHLRTLEVKHIKTFKTC